MLTRILARTVALVLAAAVVTVAAAAPSAANHEVYCPPDGGPCTVIAHKPGEPGEPTEPSEPGGGGGGGGSNVCPTSPFRVCYHPDFGWFNPQDGCHYAKMQPQPPAGDPLWKGHDPSEGAVYIAVCNIDGKGATAVFLTTPPPGFGGVPSAALLAELAVDLLPIEGPAIGIAPSPAGYGLTGLPVWMWTTVTPATWGPASATASVPGMSVTATANATKIVWDMGNGHKVTCANPGTPHTNQAGKSPTCGYHGRSSSSSPSDPLGGYPLPSSTVEGGRYTVTGTTTWRIDWVGGGQRGVIWRERLSSTTIEIREGHVLTS